MQTEINELDRFMVTLEWLMALEERYPNGISFGLAHVCFHGREKLGLTYGARDAAQMLRELSNQLRTVFRKTDLIARDGTDFWILVPYTKPETVTNKLSTLIEVASENGLDVVDRDVAFFAQPDPVFAAALGKETVRDCLAYLKENRQIALLWEQVSRDVQR